MLRFSYGARVLRRPLRPCRRSFHDDKATFVSVGRNGQLVTNEYPINLGNPHEAYVIIPPEIGRAFQAVAATHLQSASSFAVRDSEIKCPLWFYHKTRHFTHESNPNFPRLELSQDLPRQSDDDKSPATLWVDCKMHGITLNGTPDKEFHEMAAETAKRLGLTLDRLKDM